MIDESGPSARAPGLFRAALRLTTGAMWSAFASLRSFAEAEKINPSYIARVLRLTLLAPDIVEVILYGQQPAGSNWTTCSRHFRWNGSGRRGFHASQHPQKSWRPLAFSGGVWHLLPTLDLRLGRCPMKF